MCTLRFLKHVFEALLAKNELQLVMGVLALSRKDQNSQAPHQWSWVLALGSLYRVSETDTDQKD